MKKSLLQNRDRNLSFYDSWESLSQEQRNDVQINNLRKIVDHAKTHTSFYKDRLENVDFSATFPLKSVPILTATDLRAHSFPDNRNLLATSSNTFNVFQSGGSTGGAKTTLFSCEELDALDHYNARGFFALGLKETDRVANLFAVGGLYMTFVHINRMLQQYGCMNFPFSNHTAHDFVNTVATQFRINTFTGISSVVMATLRGLWELGNRNLEIEKVFFGGEHLYDADKEEIRQRFGTKVIAAPGYGTVDSWYIGYQCLHCPTGVFHAHDDACYLEIIDEESGEHCQSGETGTLLATPTVRYLTPIIRYRVGDRAQWIKEACVCGRTTPLFRLLGRSDDVLRIGFDSVDYAYVQEVALEIDGATGTIQMEKMRVQGKDQLIVRVETFSAECEWKKISTQFAAAIVASRPSLREFVESGSVWPVIVECLKPNSLARNVRTGKLKRIIDAIKEP